jgi:hypothetical protein
MNKERMYKVVSITIIVILVLLNLKSCKNTQDTKKDYVSTINALQDTMITYRNKDGMQVAKISLIETEKASQFLEINSKDAVIIKLQEEVKKNKNRMGKSGSITVIENTTNLATVDTTSYITFKDTIVRNDTVFVYPEYSSFIKKGLKIDSSYWVTANVKANKDSTSFELGIQNSYTVVLGREKSKGFKALFKPKVAFAEVTNENPYTSTKTIRAYQVKTPKPKRFGIGVHVGYGLTFDKNYTPIIRPYIGIGFQYNIIQIL